MPPTRLDDWASHTLRRFSAPWAPKGSKERLEVFTEFYFRALDNQDYRNVRDPAIRAIAYPLNQILFGLARIRLTTKHFEFPIEARLALGVMKLYRRARLHGALGLGKLLRERTRVSRQQA